MRFPSLTFCSPREDTIDKVSVESMRLRPIGNLLSVGKEALFPFTARGKVDNELIQFDRSL